MIHLKRVYEAPVPEDGSRILVDRLWPRGLTKERAAAEQWMKEIAPSPELRKWFGHDPAKWAEFRNRYCKELQENQEAVAKLLEICRKEKVVTLVYAAKDEEHNAAVVLKEFLEGKKGTGR